MRLIRLLAIAIFGGAALVVAQVVTARLLPPIGSMFYLITVAFLEAFEGHGFPTLKGAPDGWPIPTELGLYFAAAVWWIVWFIILAVWLWWRASRSSVHVR